MPDNIPRSPQRIREHYLIERDLAQRLKNAGPQERPHLYGAIYDELFRRLPDHPLLVQKIDAQAVQAAVAERLALLRPWLYADATYLEIGPGDCALAKAVAAQVRKVYAVEASQEISSAPDRAFDRTADSNSVFASNPNPSGADHAFASASNPARPKSRCHSEPVAAATGEESAFLTAKSGNPAMPDNLELIVSGDGTIPTADNSVTIAYSDQLLEHLHPDDAVSHLQNIYRALAPSGTYICITPNRLSGPHDISRDFDDVATGLHLKEYTVGELAALFCSVGFVNMRVLVGARGHHIAFPVTVIAALEAVLTLLPRALAKPLARHVPARILLGIKLVAQKPAAFATA